MQTFSRRRLLVAGAATGATLAVGVPAALAGAPVPAPIDDDLAYLQVCSVGSLIEVELLRQALLVRGLLAGDERASIHDIYAAEQRHHTAVNAALGADAPKPGDYTVVLPKGALASVRRVAQHATVLETAVRGAVLGGTAKLQDPGTRALLAKVLVADSEHLAVLRPLAGRGGLSGPLPSAVSLERATAALDPYLEVDAPSSSLAARVRRSTR